MARANAESPRRAGLSLVTLAAFLLGVPLGVGALLFIYEGPWRGSLVFRYVSHPVEWAEVVLFSCALMALLAKVWENLGERWSFRTRWVPAWDGQPLPAERAKDWLQDLRRQTRGRQKTFLGRRIAAILDFVSQRGSADHLDDHMRALADNDALAMDGSYSLLRFITWAIPILGFLGTVLGITDAVANVTPEQLEQSLSAVTGGLATAFDTTALALALTMVLMFGSFVTERLEQNLLEGIDQYADEHLAHVFARTAGADGGAFASLLHQSTQSLLRTVEQLVQQQADIWAQSLQKAEQRWHQAGAQQQQLLTTALENALQRTLASHGQQVAELDRQAAQRHQALLQEMAHLTKSQRESTREQQAVFGEAVAQLRGCQEALAAMQEAEGQLVRSQDILHRNLTALAGAGAFEQAVQSLTAAVHLLTARLAATPPAVPSRAASGKAAA